MRVVCVYVCVSGWQQLSRIRNDRIVWMDYDDGLNTYDSPCAFTSNIVERGDYNQSAFARCGKLLLKLPPYSPPSFSNPSPGC